MGGHARESCSTKRSQYTAILSNCLTLKQTQQNCARLATSYRLGANTKDHHSCAPSFNFFPKRAGIKCGRGMVTHHWRAEHDALVVRTDVKNILADVHIACCGSCIRPPSHYSRSRTWCLGQRHRRQHYLCRRALPLLWAQLPLITILVIEYVKAMSSSVSSLAHSTMIPIPVSCTM